MKKKRLTESLRGASLKACTVTKSGNVAGVGTLSNCHGSNASIRCPEQLSKAEFGAAVRLRDDVPRLRCLSHITRKHKQTSAVYAARIRKQWATFWVVALNWGFGSQQTRHRLEKYF